MNVPADLKYTESHEWVRVEATRAYVGITDYAQESLGDIVYIELPEVDKNVAKDEELTTIESVKAAEPIHSPLSGKVVEVNEDLNETPEIINQKPYQAFLFALEISDTSEIGRLLSNKDYEELVAKEEST